MASDPEELLRSIERTREELANTVDTIAGRLDPKRVAKRGVDAMREGVTTVVNSNTSGPYPVHSITMSGLTPTADTSPL